MHCTYDGWRANGHGVLSEGKELWKHDHHLMNKGEGRLSYQPEKHALSRKRAYQINRPLYNERTYQCVKRV